ncbi:hypothetical protein ACQ4WP_21645 [Janthinobacterium sp. GB4P2]|uniref:hypothetical protein n=1 Tax=Janthinobacterium sp. GB4P2 TaxID=3424189 RepID=UPI003F224BA6
MNQNSIAKITSVGRTFPCARPVFTYRIFSGATMLSQAAFDDFLLCVLTAQQMKNEFLSKLGESVLRVEVIYPHGARVPSADLAAAEAALAAPAPGTEFGCPIRKNIGQLVESRRGSASPSFMVVDAPGTASRQSSNVHAVAGAGEFCRASAMGGPVCQSTLISRELAA